MRRVILQTPNGAASVHTHDGQERFHLPLPHHTMLAPFARSPRHTFFQSAFHARHSHVGARAIPVPSEVQLSLSAAPASPLVPLHLRNSTILHVKGPKGALDVPLQVFMKHNIDVQGATPQAGASPSEIRFSVQDETERKQRATWGLTRQLAANAIHGVSQGHTASLQLVGVGFRASMEGSQTLSLKLGYPNLINLKVPAGIEVEVPSPTEILLKGADKAQLGQFAAQIRQWRKPEPYNGKVSSVARWFFLLSYMLTLTSLTCHRASLSMVKPSVARRASASREATSSTGLSALFAVVQDALAGISQTPDCSKKFLRASLQRLCLSPELAPAGLSC